MTQPRASRADLLDRLEALGIDATTYEHEAVFTVAESADLKAQWPGGHSKNLFLTDRKAALILISALDDTEIPLKRLHRHFGCGRLSFASAGTLETVLGVTPGSVTAFALINDADRRVRFCLDAALMACETVHFHPLVNTASTALAPADLVRFAQACGHEPEIIDFTALSLD